MTRLPSATWLLTLAQSLNLTTAVVMVTVGAVAGSELASDPAVATVPYGIQFASVMVLTYPASVLMRHFGRRAVFAAGCSVLILAGCVGWLAASRASFALLVLAHGLVGAYIACANFYRFAAVDCLEPQARPRAMSWVVAGGVAAAVVGPWIASSFRTIPGAPTFAGVYGALSLIGALNLAIILRWRGTTNVPTSQAVQQPSRLWTGGGDGMAIATAIAVAAGGYLLMNLVMVQSSLVLKEMCSFDDASKAIQAHVVAMFAPSFITGRWIERWGIRSILISGIVLIGLAGLIGSAPPRFEWIVLSLILLGLGWNFTYVGGGALLSQVAGEASKHRWQGIHDSVVAACATVGAFMPSFLLAFVGWQNSNQWIVAICAAGAITVWRVLGKWADEGGSAAASAGGRESA